MRGSYGLACVSAPRHTFCKGPRLQKINYRAYKEWIQIYCGFVNEIVTVTVTITVTVTMTITVTVTVTVTVLWMLAQQCQLRHTYVCIYVCT